MNYFVRYIGHIIESKRPENFPREIYIDEEYSVETEADIAMLVNKQAGNFVRQQGMIVLIDPSGVQEGLMHDKRMFVPMHMIAFIHTVTKMIVPSVTGQNLLEGETEVKLN